MLMLLLSSASGRPLHVPATAVESKDVYRWLIPVALFPRATKPMKELTTFEMPGTPPSESAAQLEFDRFGFVQPMLDAVAAKSGRADVANKAADRSTFFISLLRVKLLFALQTDGPVQGQVGIPAGEKSDEDLSGGLKFSSDLEPYNEGECTCRACDACQIEVKVV